MPATEHGNPVVDLRRSSPADFESFYECLASVILERRFLALIEAPPYRVDRLLFDE
jgi:hypothetical protein